MINQLKREQEKFAEEVQQMVNLEAQKQNIFPKTVTYYLPTTEEFAIVKEHAEKIGKYFAENRYIDAWTPSNKISFKSHFPTAGSKKKIQLAVRIALKIWQKDYDFFCKNRVFLHIMFFESYKKGWLAFGKNIIEGLKGADVETFIDEKYEEIFG